MRVPLGRLDATAADPPDRLPAETLTGPELRARGPPRPTGRIVVVEELWKRTVAQGVLEIRYSSMASSSQWHPSPKDLEAPVCPFRTATADTTPTPPRNATNQHLPRGVLC